MRIPQSEKFPAVSGDVIRRHHRNDSGEVYGWALCKVFMVVMFNYLLDFVLFHITCLALRWSGISEYTPHFFATIHLHHSISESHKYR